MRPRHLLPLAGLLGVLAGPAAGADAPPRLIEMTLSARTAQLPAAVKVSRERLDETASELRQGQFEIFIPASQLHLDRGCKGHYVVQMPRTANPAHQADIQAKQAYFDAIGKALRSKTGGVHAVIAIPAGTGCHLAFHTDADGRYLDDPVPTQP